MTSRNAVFVASAASNLVGKSEKRVELSEFLTLYPQFENANFDVMNLMLDQANSKINEKRWHSSWKLAVCLYTAHLITLWMKSSVDPNADPSVIVSKGDSKGALSSKSVGGVSVSYGSTSADGDLAGFGTLRDTIYGQQLASMARMVGKGMMVVR